MLRIITLNLNGVSMVSARRWKNVGRNGFVKSATAYRELRLSRHVPLTIG